MRLGRRNALRIPRHTADAHGAGSSRVEPDPGMWRDSNIALGTAPSSAALARSTASPARFSLDENITSSSNERGTATSASDGAHFRRVSTSSTGVCVNPPHSTLKGKRFGMTVVSFASVRSTPARLFHADEGIQSRRDDCRSRTLRVNS